MQTLRRWAEGFLQDEAGTSVAQFAVVAALIVLFLVWGVKSVGTASNTQLNNANNQLQPQAGS